MNARAIASQNVVFDDATKPTRLIVVHKICLGAGTEITPTSHKLSSVAATEVSGAFEELKYTVCA